VNTFGEGCARSSLIDAMFEEDHDFAGDAAQPSDEGGSDPFNKGLKPSMTRPNEEFQGQKVAAA
jgi:hypothetical protein